LTSFAARLEKQVKTARAAGDVAATLVVAKAAAEQIEQRVGAEWKTAIYTLTEPECVALLAVKRWTFNAAADCWPGWQLNGLDLSREQLAAAREVARYSSHLVETLSVGPLHEGTAYWLIGAFELALGRFDEALALFSKSHQRYVIVPAPDLALLVEGYVAITYQVAQRPLPSTAKTLDQSMAAISGGGFENGAEWVVQLRTALQVFHCQEYIAACRSLA
jgi:hypothetical protein